MPAGIMPSPAVFCLTLASSSCGMDVSLAGDGAASRCIWQLINNIPAMTGEIGIYVLFTLIKTGKYFSFVTVEQLLGCAGKTTFW